MKKVPLYFLVFSFTICNQLVVFSQDTTALKGFLLGRWELLKYSEQGLAVDKKQPALPQAQRVYAYVSDQRALQYYGYNEDAGERRRRAFERWEERDSIREVNRIAAAVEMPYFAVFFADSTLALYNKDRASGTVLFPESRSFLFSPATMSMQIASVGGYSVQWHAQVLALTRDRLVLFLPEDGEVVELIKTAFVLP